jgi:hypothetical protein
VRVRGRVKVSFSVCAHIYIYASEGIAGRGDNEKKKGRGGDDAGRVDHALIGNGWVFRGSRG